MRFGSVAWFVMALSLSACAGGERAATGVSTTPVPTPTTAAFGRAFHLAFQRNFKASFLASCSRNATSTYCRCVERGYERAFTDGELSALGNGTASDAVRGKSGRIIRLCGSPRGRRATR